VAYCLGGGSKNSLINKILELSKILQYGHFLLNSHVILYKNNSKFLGYDFSEMLKVRFLTAICGGYAINVYIIMQWNVLYKNMNIKYTERKNLVNTHFLIYIMMLSKRH